MKKKIIGILGIFILILGIIFLFNMNNKGKIYIDSFNYYEPGANYTVEIDEDRNMLIKITHYSSAIDGKSTYSENEVKLTYKELSKIKKVMKYFDKKYSFERKEGYDYYYDSSVIDKEIKSEDMEIIAEFLSSLEFIAADDMREEGNERLDSVLDKIK